MVGYPNMAGRIPASASALYWRTVAYFPETMVDKGTRASRLNRADELIKATMLTDGGEVVHPNFVDPDQLDGQQGVSPEPAKQWTRRSNS